MRVNLLIALGALLIAPCLGKPAAAQNLKLCSEHVLPIYAVVAYPFHVQGWWKILPNECVTTIAAQRQMLVYASDAIPGGLRWQGGTQAECLEPVKIDRKLWERTGRLTCGANEEHARFIDINAERDPTYTFGRHAGVELCNNSGSRLSALYAIGPIGSRDPMEGSGWLSINPAECVIPDESRALREIVEAASDIWGRVERVPLLQTTGFYHAYSNEGVSGEWPGNNRYEPILCFDPEAEGRFKIYHSAGQSNRCRQGWPGKHFTQFSRAGDARAPQYYRINLSGSSDDDRPDRMLPPSGSGLSSAPSVGTSIKVFCSLKDDAGKTITLASRNPAAHGSADCVAVKLDDYKYYSITASSDSTEVCGTDSNLIKQACSSWSGFQDEIRKTAGDFTNDRNGYKRMGFKIGAWAGGMSAADAVRARRGEVNAPYQAYMGEQLGEGFYESLHKQGKYDRAALILFPIQTVNSNTPFSQAVSRGDLGAVVEMATSIANDEARVWFDKQAQEIKKYVDNVQAIADKAKEVEREAEKNKCLLHPALCIEWKVPEIKFP